ncbi:lipoprotein lipase-like [Bicyclus anynana]|uniref:Lipoprotein lipase-like n=1 Tax=Bicyclus anynana TaxID=110368 RepID=A0A6J1MLU0_BICAN|nr:lipoprotein lipase-like [Bicyclus anynana]
MVFYCDVSLVTILGFLAFPIISLSHNTPEESAANYGGDWTYFVDDYGDSLVLNFSKILDDTEDFIVGDAYFYLYTRNNNNNPENLTIPEIDEPIQSVYFNKSNDIRILTHGWRTSASVEWLQKIKDAFLREYDINVIIVDWYELSKNEIYPLAAISTRYVGSRVARLINTLAQTYGLSGQNIHLIGHSLGAHVMGYAGMFSKQKIFRITGLDPARPLFEIPAMPADFCLDKNDAEFVDIIHTSGGVYGYRRSYGHADFYPNNGLPMQPGCNGIKQAIDACSHSRSHEYFEESIEYKPEEGFVAYVCDSWEDFENDKCKENPTSSMGYPASPKSNGNYYLRTRNESKYADVL